MLSDEGRIELLRTRDEDQWFDRSSRRVEARALADTLIGFANADGGLICIGIHDGRVEGVGAAGTELLNEWQQAAANFTEPQVPVRWELIECTNDSGGPDHLLLMEVEVSEHAHRNRKDETFLRIGDENRRLGIREAQELIFDKGSSVFDGSAAERVRRSDLDPDRVSSFVERLVPGRARRPDDILAARGLVTTRGVSRRPTVAGVLLLGSEPQRTFPEAVVRILRYRGSARGTGSRSNVVRDVRIGGTLLEQIEGARRRVARLLPSAIRLQETGKFGSTSVLPQAAWLEAIVNAVIHRSYSLAGDHIRVEVFDDRLEVESPGRLPGLVRVENIRSTRYARNPRIARAMADLDYGRELGEGVDRMFEEMVRAGFPEPIYREGPASVKVTFLFDSVFGAMLERLPRGSEMFVEYLSRNGRITTTEAKDLLGMSRPTTLNWLHELQQAGILEHVGTSLKDPRGFWRARFSPPRNQGKRS